jgi:hypothetical protein
MLGILAICFAPGATSPQDDAPPRAMVAAVLAPTVTDHGGSTAAAPREAEVALALVAALVGLVLALEQTRRFAPALDARARRVALPPRRRPPRRGPPLLAG